MGVWRTICLVMFLFSSSCKACLSLRDLLKQKKPKTFFVITPQPLQRIENDVELLGEHLSLGAGLHYPPATHPALTPHSTQLHFLSHEPLPQELFGMVSWKINLKIEYFGCSQWSHFFFLIFNHLQSYPNFIPRRLPGRRYRSQQPLPPSPYHPSLLPYFLWVDPFDNSQRRPGSRGRIVTFPTV